MAEEKDDSKEILEIARDRFKLGSEAWSKCFELGEEDLEFKAGIQWDEKMRADRESTHRPCLTINRLHQYTRQITNDQRQNRPSIRVLPAGEGAKEELAKIYQGVIRHIEYQSNAESVYDHSFEGAVDKGFGFFRIITEFESPTSFNQVVRIKRIPDHFSVIFDPWSREPDGSDANWAFVFEDLQKSDFKAKYPKAEISTASEKWDTQVTTNPDWVEADSIRVAEYFYKDFKEETLIGWATDSEEFGYGASLESDFEALKAKFPEITFVEVNRRKTTTATVKWVKFAGDEILEETEFPSQWIPIIPTYGTETKIDGKRVFEGAIRHAKDPQRMYNFWVTAETEMIALAPKAPYIAAEGQIEGYEKYWESANVVPHSVLPYKPVSVDGIAVPPPQRNSYEPPVQAITNARMQSVEDMKATTGMYDAAMGNRSNEQSGVAIQRRASQAQTANYHFVDNLNLSIKHTGRILLEVIPVVYDIPRAQQIVAEDGQAEVIWLNKEFERNGKNVKYDLSIGKYDVVVEAGPGFATKRQEAVASMLEFISAYPQAASVIGDILAKNMDWLGAQEIAERLRKTIPPHILGENDQEVPPQVQAQIAQMTQMIQLLQGQLQSAQFELQTKNAQKQAELASKERIALMGNETELQKEAMKIPVPGAFEALAQQVAEINQRLQMVGFSQPMVPQMPGPQFQQNFSGAGPAGQPPIQEQPTGGLPGQPMGVMP